MVAAVPDNFNAWFEAGLFSKAIQDWPECVRRNERAVELFTPEVAEAFDGVNPAAWNLGVAATALGDWATARRAWASYGIDLYQGAEPIDIDYGSVPIRINPDRPSLPHTVQPHHGATEVIWCWRRSPAHAVVASVPLPESGHRFRDVLLHDGEPKGSRMLGDREVAVFDELLRLQDSGLPTWKAEVSGADEADLEALGDRVGPLGLGVDNWSGMRIMCAECSHGNADTRHDHAPPAGPTLRLGIAGPEDAVRAALGSWAGERAEVEVLRLELLW